MVKKCAKYFNVERRQFLKLIRVNFFAFLVCSLLSDKLFCYFRIVVTKNIEYIKQNLSNGRPFFLLSLETSNLSRKYFLYVRKFFHETFRNLFYFCRSALRLCAYCVTNEKDKSDGNLNFDIWLRHRKCWWQNVKDSWNILSLKIKMFIFGTFLCIQIQNNDENYEIVRSEKNELCYKMNYIPFKDNSFLNLLETIEKQEVQTNIVLELKCIKFF